MRIVEVFEPPEGGLPEHVCDLSTGLAARGHEMIAVGPPDARVRARLVAAGVDYRPVPVSGSLFSPGLDVRFARTLRRLLIDERADVMHAHGQKAGVLGRISAQQVGVPAVYTPHSFVYRAQKYRPRRSARLREWGTRWLEQLLGRRSAAVVTVAEEERAAAHDDHITRNGRLHLIRYGITCDANADPDPGLMSFKAHHLLFGMVANLREQKGLPTMLAALERLRHDSEDMRFAIVGNGPLEDEVRFTIRDRELSDFVRWFPFQHGVGSYLKALDVFVLPSYWEALPIGVLEAMCMGLPIIATAVNGTPEAVEDRVSGLLVPPYDPEALASAIRTLSHDQETRLAMGQQGKRRVASVFGVERMLDELEALYTDVATHGARHGG
jgi:glycosyltransferase involved in cell wall biosynthesis